MSRTVNPLFAWLVIISVGIVPGWATIFVLCSLISDRRVKYCEKPEVSEPLTVLVAAYNEEASITETLASIARQNYLGRVRVLVINDGSTDATAARVRAFAATVSNPNLTVELLDQPHNMGKARALNRGLSATRTDLVATIDGDTYLHPKALSNITKTITFCEPKMGAVAGTILVRNSRTNFLTRMQEWDYFHGIGVIKRAQSLYHGTLVAQGAFSIYRTAVVREAGGWKDLVGEDIVLTWSMRSNGHAVGYSECSFAFTNAPASFRQFFRQRERWARGLIEAFKNSPKSIFQLRMNSPFIWYNMFFPLIDAGYLLFFVPGIILALFGYHLLAGLLTLLLLPMAIIGTIIYFRFESDIFKTHGLHVRRNWLGLLGYLLVYQFLMTIASLTGYVSEILNLSKKWGTK